MAHESKAPPRRQGGEMCRRRHSRAWLFWLFALSGCTATSPSSDHHGVIRDMLDEWQITSQMHAYTQALNSGDHTRYGELFAQGCWVSAEGEVIAAGAEPIAALARKYMRPKADTIVRHLVTSPEVVVLPGRKTAVARSFLTTIRSAQEGEGIAIFRIASYRDVFQRHDGDDWQFLMRQEVTDWVSYDLVAHYEEAAGEEALREEQVALSDDLGENCRAAIDLLSYDWESSR